MVMLALAAEGLLFDINSEVSRATSVHNCSCIVQLSLCRISLHTWWYNLIITGGCLRGRGEGRDESSVCSPESRRPSSSSSDSTRSRPRLSRVRRSRSWHSFGCRHRPFAIIGHHSWPIVRSSSLVVSRRMLLLLARYRFCPAATTELRVLQTSQPCSSLASPRFVARCVALRRLHFVYLPAPVPISPSPPLSDSQVINISAQELIILAQLVCLLLDLRDAHKQPT